MFGLAFHGATTMALTTENQVRVLLNNGIDSNKLVCNDEELATIMKAVTTRRFLRADTSKEEYPHERNLQTTYYPASCRTTCAGFTRGKCLAQGCYGYRRELKETSDAAEQDDSRLLQTDWCILAKKHAENSLDSIINGNKVSSSCVQLLNAPRTIDCMVVTC